MKRVIFIVLLVGLASFMRLPTARAQEPIDVVMFYGNGCPHCARAEEFLGQLKNEYPQLAVHMYEVYSDRDNIELFVKCGQAYGIQAGGVPTLFIGERAIVGNGQDEIRSAISECATSGCDSALTCLETKEEIAPPNPIAETAEQVDQNANPSVLLDAEGQEDVRAGKRESGKAGEESGGNELESRTEDVVADAKPSGHLEVLTIPAVIGGAAVDAINPCEFAVLILLLTTVLATGKRRRALFAGLAFTSSVFISYFLMGLGLYSVISAAGLSRVFYIVMAILAVVVGLFNLKDFLWYGKWFVMEVPLSWRPRLQKLVRGVTSVPGAFLIGFLVSLFLLPCTSGPYVVILGLLAKSATRSTAVWLLLLYNAIFVLPMLLITFAVYFGITTTTKAEAWRQSKLRFLHLVAGLIILGLGLIMLGSALLGYV